jgi:hypothetical protein
MKAKNIVLACIIGCLLLSDIYFLHISYKDKATIEILNESLNQMKSLSIIESLYNISKEIAKTRLRYEQYPLNNRNIYIGSDTSKIMSIKALVDRPKLIFGSSQDMCSPCVFSVLDQLAEIIPNYSYNEDVIFIADIENRLKENYHNKKVVSFLNEKDFPLYKIKTPYLFILDNDLVVKMLFIADKSSPELTKEYLKAIKTHFSNF